MKPQTPSPNPLRPNSIEKRCDACKEIFLIPLIRGGGYLQRLVCQHSACPFCNPNIAMCKGCYVPFRVQKHYGKGMCKTCYLLYFRSSHYEKEEKSIL